MVKKIYLFIVLFSLSFVALAQKEAQRATSVVKTEYVKNIPSIAEQIKNGTFQVAETVHKAKEVNIKRRDANVTVPGKGLPHGVDPLVANQQNRKNLLENGEPIITFEVASSSVTPTDPTGAVGPNHFVNSWNPIVVYDRFVDRFVIMEFSDTPNGILVAVCQGSDPVNDGWFTYRFNMGSFPDYPKLTIWSDGYYVTANKNSSSASTSEVVFALQRDLMIAGDENAQMVGFPLPGIRTSGFYSPLGFNVNGAELPPSGNSPIVYMQDDSWGGVSEDHLKVWNINVNWDSPASSEISDPQEIPTTPFDGVFDGGSFSNLPQPSGQDIDALQATIMFMAQYRRFSTHNSVVFNFVVDVDGSDDLAGIRWYELRQESDGAEWTIFQEGTYVQPDGHSAFAGTMCIDVNGNIGMAYTVVSRDVFPSLRFTGRLNGDESGVMTFEEKSLVEGLQVNPSYRYGDYSQMTVDPNDDVTFWSIGETFRNGTRKNWVGAFQLAPAYTNNGAVKAITAPESGILTANESITVTIQNLGLESLTNVPVSYRINGGAPIEETIAGPILSYESVDYTFAQTADMSTLGQEYEIVVNVELAGDEQPEDNELSKTVMYLYPQDVGIKDIIAPLSGEGLSEEVVVAVVKNFGTETVSSNFNLTYIVDNGSTVYESFTEDLEPGEEVEFEFNSTADLSAVGEHTIAVKTAFSDDMNEDNDEFQKVITTEMCAPQSNCTTGAGIRAVFVGDIENYSNCEEDGYGDFNDMNTVLYKGYTHDLIIVGQKSDQYAKVWIDLNDNFLFEADEVFIDNEILAEGMGSGTFADTLGLVLPDDVTLGEHLMRIKVAWISPVPDNSCEAMQWGETEDYTVTLDFDESVETMNDILGDFEVHTLGNNHFRAQMESDKFDETIFVTVHDVMGRKLIQNRVRNVGGVYQFDFDMSYARSGMYLVRFGNHQFGKVQKIVVE